MSHQQPSLDEAAIVLVTGRLAGVPDALLAGIVAEVDRDDLVFFLADAMAYAVRETAGGERWLRRWALAVAGRGF